MNRLLHTLLALFLGFQASAQTITGHFPELAGQKISLTGFEGMNVYTIDMP